MFYVAALHNSDANCIHWYTGQPAGEFVSEAKYAAYEFPDELSAARVVKRLNGHTSLHGYTFSTIPRNCDQEHALRRLRTVMLRAECGRERTTVEMFRLGDNVVSTVHRIAPDGTETADILDVQPCMDLELVDDARPRGEFTPYK